jgi:hypothetical protein
MNTVKLSDKHLQVIRDALETYFRMKTGQVSIALDTVYDYKLNHEQSQAIESIVKAMVLPEIASRGTSYSFNSPQIGEGKIAYEITKVIDEYLSVKKNDGYYGHTVDFSGPLKASEEPLPEILEHKNYKDFVFDKKQSAKANKLYSSKNFDKLWEYVYASFPDLPKGEKIEIVPSFANVTVRVYKPRKLNDKF